MNERRWCTKEDVQKDLAQATGQRLPEVDEGFFVYGERPPPPRVCGDEDTEVEHQFGRAAGALFLQQPAPDLRGITKMLQMVKNNSCGDSMENISDLTSPMATDSVIVISKLKPQSLRQPIRPINPENLQQDISKLKPQSLWQPIRSINPENLQQDISKLKPQSLRQPIRPINPENLQQDISKLKPQSLWQPIRSINPENLQQDISKLKPQSLWQPIRPINPENWQQDISKLRPQISQKGLSISLSANPVTLLSKLNPNVKEFIPKSEAIPSSQIENSNLEDSNMDTNTIISSKLDEQQQADKINTQNVNSNNIIEQRTTDSGLDEYQIERAELAAMLKHKIYSARGDDDSFEFRRQKYAAISNLMRLHSSATAPAPLRLRTPDSFVCRGPDSAESRLSLATDNSDSGNETASTPKTTTTTGNLGARIAPEAGPAAPEPGTEVEGAVDEREVRASIRKVSDWLDSDSEPREPRPPPPPPPLHLGPVTYKRKQRSAAASPAPGAEGPGSGAYVPGAYVPSAHARELGRRYAARAAEARDTRTPDMWERLQDQLRRKDEELLTPEPRPAL